MNDLSVVILAAGKGSRMHSPIPKVMHNVAGLPIIGHIIDAAKNSVAKQIVTVVSPSLDLSVLPICLSDVDIAVQDIPKGTGHAVVCSIDIIKSENILVLYGDTPLITSETIDSVFSEFLEQKTDCAVLAINVDENSSFGRLELDDKGSVIKIVESSELEEGKKYSNLCNVGILIKTCLAKKLLPQLKEHKDKKEFFLTDVVYTAYTQTFATSYIECNKEEMYGINTMQDLAKVEATYQDKMRNNFMRKGVKLLAPETVFFSYDTKIDSNVIIHQYVVFGRGVTLKEGTEVFSFSHIEGCTIDSSSVGPFARIRKGTEISKNAKIGNFVEVKNSRIYCGSKINHLSYIGDADVGESVNIGAGTITCNYDGFTKSKTDIKSGAFVGSNTCLIAPVSVGENAIIAAGSVISENVEKDAIGITRAEQKNLKNKAKNYREKRRK